MARGFGVVDLFAEAPTAIVVLAAVLTQLGDVWFLFLLLGLLYWFGDQLPWPLSLGRDRAAFLVALSLGASTVTTTFKEWLAFPRPTGAGEAVGADLVPALLRPAYVDAATATGFGFPSGHALGATVVYGGLALEVGTRRAYAAAATIVPLIALTRLVLGVHYTVDVLVGVTVGGVFLVAVWKLCDDGTNVGRALLVAVAVALVGAAETYGFRTMASLGGAVGARIAWGVVGDAVLHEDETRAGGVVAALVGAAFAGLFGALYGYHVRPALAFVGVGVAIAGVLAAPVFGEAVARRFSGRSGASAPAGD